ncbi:hypothetical protein B0H17DRAFT_1205268 [Mycena rosella]|uniref:Uncharacterized protein n=1 Tax=Mycena rosella TaxID=1033263 RepID=A0AAD7D8Y4_MYCRO|nr:hypothetical protein B0H17DRAFT_1205268 [Mycena rosella]
MSMPAPPFAGLVPSTTTVVPSFTRPGVTDLSAAELRTFVIDRVNRRNKAATRLKSAEAELHAALHHLHIRHQLAAHKRTTIISEAASARTNRDTAHLRCITAHEQVEEWWGTETAGEKHDPAAVLRLKNARASALARKAKPYLRAKVAGGIMHRLETIMYKAI